MFWSGIITAVLIFLVALWLAASIMGWLPPFPRVRLGLKRLLDAALAVLGSAYDLELSLPRRLVALAILVVTVLLVMLVGYHEMPHEFAPAPSTSTPIPYTPSPFVSVEVPEEVRSGASFTVNLAIRQPDASQGGYRTPIERALEETGPSFVEGMVEGMRMDVDSHVSAGPERAIWN
jgi:hypothetical protein